MVKKDYTEYERTLKDFTKKPLSKDFQKLIFPPESDVKKSEDHDPSVLPTSKLSMRKRAQEEEPYEKLEPSEGDYIIGSAGRVGEDTTAGIFGGPFLGRFKTWEEAEEVIREDMKNRSWTPDVWIQDDHGGYTLTTLEKTSFIKFNPKTSAWENLPRGWTEESLRSFWNSLGGKGEHKVTRCIEKMKGDIDNPGAFCASLERRIESSNLEGKKLAVGDKILTSTKKVAKVVKVGTELAFWMTVDGNDFGSDFVEDVELLKETTDFTRGEVPVEGGLTKEVPLEEKVDLGEKV